MLLWNSPYLLSDMIPSNCLPCVSFSSHSCSYLIVFTSLGIWLSRENMKPLPLIYFRCHSLPANTTECPRCIRCPIIGTHRVVCPRPQSSGAISICLCSLVLNNAYFYFPPFDGEKNKCSSFMRRPMAKRFIIYLLIITGSLLVAQSCSSSKGCGCGNDINKAYRQPRHR